MLIDLFQFPLQMYFLKSIQSIGAKEQPLPDIYPVRQLFVLPA